jgi:hypothetical protein
MHQSRTLLALAVFNTASNSSGDKNDIVLRFAVRLSGLFAGIVTAFAGAVAMLFVLSQAAS